MNITKEQVEAILTEMTERENTGYLAEAIAAVAYELKERLSALAARGGEPVAWIKKTDLWWLTKAATSDNGKLGTYLHKSASEEHPVALYTHPKAEVQPGFEWTSHDDKVLEDFEAMAANYDNGFWPSALAIAAIRYAKHIRDSAAPQGDNNG